VYNRRGPEQTIPFAEVAAAAPRHASRPPETEAGLEFDVDYVLPDNPYGFGAHVAVVEVDRDSGEVYVLRYVAVHDCGRIVNPRLLEGQIYGAIAQGVGQALSEGMHYSPQGQPLTGSFMDYAIPHAGDMFPLRLDYLETLSPTNALGLKGVGELPTVASPVALVNAVCDALAGTGARHLDAPLTAARIWQAMRQEA
jgi:carbon-monoxide dehydrogenase large subunit